MTADPRQLAQEVLRLDEQATPGPWAVEMDGDGDEFTSWEWPWRIKGVVNFAEEGKNQNDPPLIAAYRTAAPTLATALLADLEDQERASRILVDRDASLSAEEYEQRAADDAALLASPKAAEILGALEREALYERHLRWRTLAQVKRLHAANEELRLTLAAEQGKAEGAPHPDWRYDAGTWERYYDDGDSAIVYSNSTWARGPFGECARHKGRAPNRRAAMLAADAALSGEATTSPSALAPQGSPTPR